MANVQSGHHSFFFSVLLRNRKLINQTATTTTARSFEAHFMLPPIRCTVSFLLGRFTDPILQRPVQRAAGMTPDQNFMRSRSGSRSDQCGISDLQNVTQWERYQWNEKCWRRFSRFDGGGFKQLSMLLDVTFALALAFKLERGSKTRSETVRTIRDGGEPSGTATSTSTQLLSSECSCFFFFFHDGLRSCWRFRRADTGRKC